MARYRFTVEYFGLPYAGWQIQENAISVQAKLEEAFAIAYNDIDYCLRAGEAGYKVVWTPFATLIHHESASRGSDVAPGKIERFRREQANLRKRHATDVFEDRAINPWFSKDRSNPIISKLTHLPGAR